MARLPVNPLLGRDLRLSYASRGGLFEDAELAVVDRTSRGGRDLALADGVDNLEQAIADRLKTRRGELSALGHPGYGSRHHELIGEPNVERTRNLVKLYVLQALRDEPRIVEVLSATVRAEHSPPRESVRIEIAVRIVGAHEPLALTLPFSLESGP
jgi:phage baseplate assembly protein W